MYSKGWATSAGTFVPGEVAVTGQLGLLGGTGMNAKINGDIKAEEILPPDGEAILITITSSAPMKIEVPD